jgi:hypothetical protein
MSLSAQEETVNTENYLEGAVPEVDGKVVFSREFSIPGMEKAQVYERLRKWMDKRMAQTGNDHSRVVYDDAVKGYLAANAEEWLVFKSNALSLDRAVMNYYLTADCSDERCKVDVQRIRYKYENNEKHTAEGWITDGVALNKAKTKIVVGFRKWRVKTVDFANDIFDGVAEALGTDEEKVAAEKAAAAEAKKKGHVVITTAATTAAQPAEEVKPAAPVAQEAVASVSDEYREIAPEEVSKDAIKVGEGRLVIVVGDDSAFNMSMMTANGGGSIGRVDGKPVVFSILSPDQPYDAMEKAAAYKVRFYPTGSTTPSLLLECKRVEAPAPFEGQPRTYIGEIVKAMVK